MAQSKGANVIFILDGSASMWAKMDKQRKIAVAKERMTELVQELANVNMGLIVYGHRRKADCNDIELMVPMGSGDSNTIIERIQSISPKGKTPITKAIELAAKQLETIEEETAVVLVSDGLETCAGAPCVYVRGLKDKGIKFKMYVVGFDVKSEERKQLECIAKAGEGRYFTAKNTMQLKDALTEVKKEVVKKAVMITKAEPEPKVAVEPGLKLRAVLKEGGKPVTENMYWWVYKAEKDINGKRENIGFSTAPEPLFKLSAGRYFIYAEHGKAGSSMEVEVTAGELKESMLNLNVGYLRLNAVSKEGGKPVTENMRWTVYKAEKDINGKREKIDFSTAPEPLFKLSAGRYFIYAEHGDAASSMEAEVTSGELKEINMNLNAGYLKLHAILKEGAEPVTENMYWYVYKAEKDINSDREKVAQSGREEPLFKLSAGHYFIVAEYGNDNVTSSMEVEVTAGELNDITMNLSKAE
jgi:Ca-activated chloride channel family protein